MGRSVRPARNYLSHVVAAVAADRVIYAVLGIYVVGGAVYVLNRGGVVMGALDVYATTCLITYLLILPAIVGIIGIAKITHRLDERRLLAYRHMFGPRRVARFVAGTLLMLIVLPPFQSMFASIKNTIAVHGFTYEKLAADIDKFVHFDHAPAKYIYSVARNEWVLKAIELNYDVVWFIVCFGMLYWVAISPRADGLRLRYCLTFIAVWLIVGNVVATMFPAAGPAFYALVTDDPSRFQKLREFVGSSSGWFASAADEQHYLWTLHSRDLAGLGSGISAFPSMHVALITFNAIVIGERSRRAALFAWAYVLLIMISSVYLGWHYAVDGYAAVVLAAATCWAVKRQMPAIEALAAWWPNRRPACARGAVSSGASMQAAE